MPKLNIKDDVIEHCGLVVSYFGNSVAVETDNAQVFHCHLRKNQPLPVVGDYVTFTHTEENTGVILKIKPRHSQLMRGDPRGASKLIAANIDKLMIVMAPLPVFSTYLIDRYLVAAELLNISPIIILNKMDLLTGAEREAAAISLLPYRAHTASVLMCSVYQQQGLEDIILALQGKTGVLVGPSGVGKSSMIAALGGDEFIRVAEVSAKGTGKHTTTATRLYHLSGKGGNLIDSPGVREFNLWTVSEQDIIRGFREFQPFLKECRFRDCKHLVEPGCHLRLAVDEGKVNAKRFESYQKLMADARAK